MRALIASYGEEFTYFTVTGTIQKWLKMHRRVLIWACRRALCAMPYPCLRKCGEI